MVKDISDLPPRIEQRMFVGKSMKLHPPTQNGHGTPLCISNFIRFPNPAGQKKIQQGFREKFGFPKVLGCIDGSHIPLLRLLLTNLYMSIERATIR